MKKFIVILFLSATLFTTVAPITSFAAVGNADATSTYVDAELVGTFVDINEINEVTNSSTYENLTLISTTRFNYGSGGTVNSYNFGEVQGFGRAIRSSFCWSSNSFSYRDVSVGFGIGPVSIGFSNPGTTAMNCTTVPDSLKTRYTRIYNYNDVTIKKYKVDVYDRYSGKYLRSYDTSWSTINGFKYVPQAA